jgi:type II secretory pathway component PulF
VEEAASPAALERVLARRGLYPLEIAAGDGQRPRRHGLRTLRADVVEAIRYLATLADAGFPLDRALGTVARVVARPDVAGAVRAVQERIRAGVSLADALREQPRTFPALGVGTVRAGERGGYLAEALKRLAEQLEREEALRAQLLSAMLYPAVMVSVGAVAVVVLVVFVLPRFVAVLGDAGAALPRSTSLLLGASHVLGRWWPVFLVGAAAGVFALSSYRHSAGGRLHSDAWLLRLPVVGALRQRLAAARLGRALATLLGSGLPVLPALDAAAESLADAAATEEVQRAREEVRAGSRLAAALGRGRAFPYVFLQMVELGEESGRLPEMLDRAATAAEEELRRGLERVIRLVEPTMIILFGAVVAFVALALLQAIYSVRVDAF